MVRKSIGKYIDLRQLAQGGMAEVYIGIDPNLNRKVAIKLILPHLARQGDFEARFQQEAKTIAGLRHSNIVQIFEYSIEDGTPFMVMEYLNGGTLEDVLNGRPMPLEKAADILTKIANGLDYAHQRGIIHRDIKPSNILFSEDGEPIIADFGIVKLLSDNVDLTQTGGLLGSPRFVSPEQASQKTVDHRSDIYSLGIMLYQMVTGEAPFKGELLNVLMQHINHQPENPTGLNPALPPQAADVILKALAKRPEGRFASAGEMAHAFVTGLANSDGKQPAVTQKIQEKIAEQTTFYPLDQTIADKTLMDPAPAKKAEVSSSSISFKMIGGALGLIALVVVAGLFLTGRFNIPEGNPSTQPVLQADTESAPASPGRVGGTITYSYEGRVYSLAAQEGATPIDISATLDKLSPNGNDTYLNVSPNGAWLVLETERFDPECSGWACLAVVPADLSSGAVIRSNTGAVVRSSSSISAISSGGDLVVYDSDEGPHELDLWAVSKISETNSWGIPLLLTADSEDQFNYLPAISTDGNKLVFNCGSQPYSGGDTSICQVNADGSELQRLLTPADAPAGFPTTGALHQPDYAPDGGIVFEADWEGERIWRLSPAETEPVLISNSFNNDNSPCVLPDGRIASLWLGRDGSAGLHELKIMEPDGSQFFIVIPNLEITDAGIGCAP